VPALAFASTPVTAALLAAVAGFVTSPLMITGLSLVEVRADIARLTETLAYPTAGLAIGGTVGALVCGVVVDSHGPQSGYLVTAIAAVFVALAALASEGVRSLVTTSDVGGVRRM
jgi:predicted MFS family arabinose efflux permease